MSTRSEFMSIEAAAAYAGVPVRYITNRLSDPLFPKRRKGASWVIPRKPLDDYIDSHDTAKKHAGY